MMPEQAREHLVLVREFPAAIEHRALVQWRKRDRIDLAQFRKVDRARERLAGQSPGLGAGPAERKARRIDIAEIDELHRTAMPRRVGWRRDALDIEPDPGMRH